MKLKKNMKPGNKGNFFIIFLFLFSNVTFADDKITSAPLINLNKIKPSFEAIDEGSDNLSINKDLKEKKKIKKSYC